MRMRILVSFETHHHAYGDAIARAIQYTRPRLDVSITRSEAFALEVSRLRPDIVISDRPKDEGKAAAWVEIPTDPDPVSRICVGGRCRRLRNPSFDELLAVVDEAERLSG